MDDPTGLQGMQMMCLVRKYGYFFLSIVVLWHSQTALSSSPEVLNPVYNAMLKGAVPGLSELVRKISHTAADDYSDDSFINQAKCAYTLWAVRLNLHIRDSEDVEIPDSRLLEDKEGYFDLTSAEYCQTLGLPLVPGSQDIEFPPTQYRFYFPVQSFLETVQGAYSPIQSFVQSMPSYEEDLYNADNDSVPTDMRERVVIETILYMLGKLKKDKDHSEWANQYTDHIRQSMRQFHCSRYIKQDDHVKFSDCLSAQTDDDKQRSDHAIKLTDIALGDFSLPSQGDGTAYDFGYSPGFAVAARSYGCLPGSFIQHSVSPLAESFVMLFLMKKWVTTH